MREIGKLDDLQFLAVNGVAVTDAGVVELRKLKLRSLSMPDTSVTGKELSRLTCRGSLEMLNLNNTRFDDAGAAELVGFELLR
ncbi:MAG: hypothetical protein EXS16_18775 [Gemmataceae bacterium]|nr:hypothetical protein [Gemmataceae bacterium]